MLGFVADVPGRERCVGRHRVERADDLELAGGFARKVERAVEVAGAELAEGEFEQHAGLAETRRRLEKHERIFFEGGDEFAFGRFLAGPQFG